MLLYYIIVCYVILHDSMVRCGKVDYIILQKAPRTTSQEARPNTNNNHILSSEMDLGLRSARIVVEGNELRGRRAGSFFNISLYIVVYWRPHHGQVHGEAREDGHHAGLRQH